jgi:hypothetical protein
MIKFILIFWLHGINYNHDFNATTPVLVPERYGSVEQCLKAGEDAIVREKYTAVYYGQDIAAFTCSIGGN